MGIYSNHVFRILFLYDTTAFIDGEDTKKGFDVLEDVVPRIYRIDRIER